ncbi:hypothetical protein A3D84_00125 [Candidatus Woesebacteria bacterium RIFCSPHIGHO2_02_FULL_42_20]|uniref:Uncharacterized protein n=1 Tax=Candidatus Woesebacteria bacterium RIFCSPHIGHO2_12_FULL_41_24 TaxID=1802510 RepID=A0A1F8ATR1_9BACT|nr:MAG: hypothetical protein A2W15_01625 [Candidatus Woesebacteria bacterium RBG_16_41_13]OGM28845.1 MAG: hypothetical protein A2873_05160 [Candidatus Woesebacteria bacterium RIFCSPHIGHO2_01_FULL_42_80]OGM35187.1 MAG: hypothetical protein A3D84_00125 [Candidatus Woesebacteria bacterium RIFCSPHIGHO2_02_FULL_42_20]OGM55081.1 MAG: hypothetical protein A3E44_04135 [Candidatus Woesebacteria bacterium RIFCSPHIGHO2_12_FULL_41_24]OGM70626.1 MAG: hypothetical protein A3I55_02570 [Candidatus Woesebacteri
MKKLTKNKLIFGVVLDVLLVVGSLILLNATLSSSRKLSQLRSLEIKYAGLVSPELVLSDLQQNEKTISDLESVFVDEQGFIDYVEKLDGFGDERLTFSFATQEPVKNRQGYLGLPLLLEFKGTKSEVGEALNKFGVLSEMVKFIDVEVLNSKDEDKLVVKVSAFLYTNEKFSGN